MSEVYVRWHTTNILSVGSLLDTPDGIAKHIRQLFNMCKTHIQFVHMAVIMFNKGDKTVNQYFTSSF